MIADLWLVRMQDWNARPPAPTMQTNGRTGTYPSLVNINSDKGISVIGT